MIDLTFPDMVAIVLSAIIVFLGFIAFKVRELTENVDLLSKFLLRWRDENKQSIQDLKDANK